MFLDPPTVRTLPYDGYVEVKKGDYVDIGCETTGTPAPVVNWQKNVSVFCLSLFNFYPFKQVINNFLKWESKPNLSLVYSQKSLCCCALLRQAAALSRV